MPGWGLGTESSAPEVSPRERGGTPGWGLGTETSAPEVRPQEWAGGGGAEQKLLGRSRNHLTGQRLPGRLENKAIAEEGAIL